MPAAVELSSATGPSPTRWPKPQHGKGALELGLCLAAALNAAALKDREQGAALTCFVALRAREAPTEPHLLPASSAVADSVFANSGSGIGATAGAAAGAVGGGGDGAGRAELRYGAVADTMAQTSARQGGARARSCLAAALNEIKGARGRVNLLCRLTRARKQETRRLLNQSPLLRLCL